jgi:NarL family two-component system response regulator LiaR
MGQEESIAESSLSRIVVADDHPLFRSALRRVLDQRTDLEVVGEAADGQEAVELCRRLRPELVMMDLRMPGMDGLEATRRIKDESPNTSVLVLTAFEEPSDLSEALRAGAAGYVLKTASPKRIIEAVHRVLLGEFPLDQEVATRLLMRLVEEAGSTKEATKKDEPLLLRSLSPREAEVLRLIARGYTNLHIARDLFLSPSTVKKHARSIIAKLGVSDRTQAAVRAVELGVLTEHEGRTPPTKQHSVPRRYRGLGGGPQGSRGGGPQGL